MLLTKASEYALLSLIIIARQNSPQDVDTLSKRLDISRSFLAKILQNLAKEGILVSYKGANGGFMIAKEARQISVLEILEAAEKRKIAVFECSPSGCYCPSNRADFCSIWPFLNKLQEGLDTMLSTMTLQDLFER